MQRTLWLNSWSKEQQCKKCLLCMPFDDEWLFDMILKDVTGSIRIILPQKKKPEPKTGKTSSTSEAKKSHLNQDIFLPSLWPVPVHQKEMFLQFLDVVHVVWVYISAMASKKTDFLFIYFIFVLIPSFYSGERSSLWS